MPIQCVNQWEWRAKAEQRCIADGGHFWGKTGKWHMRFYKKYPSKPASGNPYWIRFQVCKKCGARVVEQKHERPTEGEFA